MEDQQKDNGEDDQGSLPADNDINQAPGEEVALQEETQCKQFEVGTALMDPISSKEEIVAPLTYFDQITAILDKYTSKYFTIERLGEFASLVARDKDSNSIKMPANLLLMTPYFEFNFVDIPMSFLSLQTAYYKRKCAYCHQEKQDSATCLLCGKTMCWFKVRDGQCKDHWEQDEKNREGLLSYHARLHEGGGAIYLQTSTGAIVMIQNGTSAKFDTPYRNKYGELANPDDKRLDSFNIDDQSGGAAALKQVKQKYLEFQVGNAILQQRTNPDVEYRVYLKHAM